MARLLRRRWLRWLLVTAAIPIVLAVAVYVSLAGWATYQGYRAECLLRQVAALRVGVSTQADVEALTAQYAVSRLDLNEHSGGKLRISRELSSVPPLLYPTLEKLDSYFFGGLEALARRWYDGEFAAAGLPCWRVRAYFVVSIGRLVEFGQTVSVYTGPFTVMAASVSIGPKEPVDPRRAAGYPAWYFNVDPNIRLSHPHLHFGEDSGWGISAYATPELSEDRLREVMKVNTACLRSGCKTFCDLAPGATREYDAQLRRQGLSPVSCEE